MVFCATTENPLTAAPARDIIERCFVLQQKKFSLQSGVLGFYVISDIKQRDETELRQDDRVELKKSKKNNEKGENQCESDIFLVLKYY